MNKDVMIKDNVITLNLINHQLAELNKIKQEIESRLCALFEHNDEGSKTYIANKFKVTVTTGFNYSLDKDEYEVLANRVPVCFNPVRKRIAYDLDKQIIRDAEKYASADELDLLSQFIEKKPKKIHVKISVGC